MVSTRANILTRRTYNRPLNDEGTKFETWAQTVDRVIGHQRWLWERAKGEPIDIFEYEELLELKELMLERKALTSGRTLWLGGTDIAKTREASMFNCSGLVTNTVHDEVDQIWLLMQGCGVGFHPEPGVLNGFMKEISKITVIRSDAKEKTYEDHNTETYENGVWTIRVGDSAEAWAKAFGKLLAGKFPAEELVFDLRPIRPGGTRLKGYGWISSGDSTISIALPKIAEILNRRAGQLLTRIDILDIGNWMGTVLSSRRSAEIALHRFGDPEWEDFATAKRLSQEELSGEIPLQNPQRSQSNNSLLFYSKPTKLELRGIFEMMQEAGGSEPGFINAEAAQKRAPWFKTVNPCAEILLGNRNFCNLVEVNLAAFNGFPLSLTRAIYLMARANYRQTCVNLRDGILQDSWHELNEFLRLCGVGVTGIVRWEEANDPESWQRLRFWAQQGAHSMADALGLPRAKAVTTVKPSGTLSKIMDTTEGVHKPLGKYIFNNVNFGKHDPLVPLLEDAGYYVRPNPVDSEGVLVTFPVAWEDIEFTKKMVKRRVQVEKPIEEWSDFEQMAFEPGRLGKTIEAEVEVEVNTESAVDQLNRYKLLMDNYVDHNCSITVSYDPSEIPEIVEWLDQNWDTYVGVSWLIRTDPSKSAADLGYLYLPQEVVTKEQYEAYVAELNPIDIDAGNSLEELQTDECAGGVCPVR